MGTHLLMDLRCFDREFMDSEEKVVGVVDKMVDLVGMRKLCEPIWFKGAEWLKGISAIVVIETSHIAMHTFSDRNKISFDLYSCKDYDTEKIVDYIIKNIKCEIINKHVIGRDDE